MSLRVYVAGSCREIDRVRRCQAFLRERGAIITHDWTADVGQAGGESNPDDATDRMRRNWAEADLEAITDADGVLFLGSPESKSPGMHVELGWALSFAHLTLVWAGHRPSIFNYLVRDHYRQDEAACEALVLALKEER